MVQINLPPDSDLDSVRRKQMLDLQYTKEASVWLDVRILLATAMRIVGIPGAVAARLAFVEREAKLPNLEDTDSDLQARSLSDTTTLKSLVKQLQHQSGNGNGHAGENGVARSGTRTFEIKSDEPRNAESAPARRKPK